MLAYAGRRANTTQHNTTEHETPSNDEREYDTFHLEERKNLVFGDLFTSFFLYMSLLACFELLEKWPRYDELVTASCIIITPRSPRVTLLVFEFQPDLFSSRFLYPQIFLAELSSMIQYDRSKKLVSFLDSLINSRG